MLELSRVEAGQLTLTRAPAALDDVVIETVDEMRDLAARRGVVLDVHTETLGHGAELDHAKIVQVMQNLVGNALKFTPSGGRIEVNVRRAGSEAFVTVEDSGPGFRRCRYQRSCSIAGTRPRPVAPAAAVGSAWPSPAPSSRRTADASAPAWRSDGERGARFWFTLPLDSAAVAAG